MFHQEASVETIKLTNKMLVKCIIINETINNCKIQRHKSYSVHDISCNTSHQCQRRLFKLYFVPATHCIIKQPHSPIIFKLPSLDAVGPTNLPPYKHGTLWRKWHSLKNRFHDWNFHSRLVPREYFNTARILHPPVPSISAMAPVGGVPFPVTNYQMSRPPIFNYRTQFDVGSK